MQYNITFGPIDQRAATTDDQATARALVSALRGARHTNIQINGDLPEYVLGDVVRPFFARTPDQQALIDANYLHRFCASHDDDLYSGPDAI